MEWGQVSMGMELLTKAADVKNRIDKRKRSKTILWIFESWNISMRSFNIWTCMDVTGRSCQCDPAPDSPGHWRHCNLVSQHQQQSSSNYFLTLVVAGAWQVTLRPILCWASHQPSPRTGAQPSVAAISAVWTPGTRRHRGSGASVDTWSQLITNTATMES